MDLGLRDRVYVVSGGSSGLGYASASALVSDGARVVVGSRRAGRVDSAADRLGGARYAVGVPGDLAAPDTPTRLIEAARASYGRLDGALISVGGPPGGTACEMTDERWRAGFESVFLGALRLARSVAAGLGAGGSIAFVLSTSVRQPIGGLAISNGLRPGLAMLAKTLADELGPRGIRVNGLLPGSIETDRICELEAGGADPGAHRADREAAIPLRRYGRPEEFGAVAAFLLSPAASYLTGAMIPVDGGVLRGI